MGAQQLLQHQCLLVGVGESIPLSEVPAPSMPASFRDAAEEKLRNKDAHMLEDELRKKQCTFATHSEVQKSADGPPTSWC